MNETGAVRRTDLVQTRVADCIGVAGDADFRIHVLANCRQETTRYHHILGSYRCGSRI
jgi:hypothetical protein